MSKKLSVLSMVLLVCGLTFAAEDAGVKPMTIGVGYDEGLSAKMFLSNKLSVNLSVGYTAIGADSVKEQPMNAALVKVGCSYLLKQFDAVRINAFLDFAETMNEGQLVRTKHDGDNLAFYQWNSSVRLGLAPEFFITNHFSLVYKLGGYVTFYGTTYKLNGDESGLEKNDNSYIKGGVLGFNESAPLKILQNVSLYFYF